MVSLSQDWPTFSLSSLPSLSMDGDAYANATAPPLTPKGSDDDLRPLSMYPFSPSPGRLQQTPRPVAYGYQQLGPLDCHAYQHCTPPRPTAIPSVPNHHDYQADIAVQPTPTYHNQPSCYSVPQSFQSPAQPPQNAHWLPPPSPHPFSLPPSSLSSPSNYRYQHTYDHGQIPSYPFGHPQHVSQGNVYFGNPNYEHRPPATCQAPHGPPQRPRFNFQIVELPKPRSN